MPLSPRQFDFHALRGQAVLHELEDDRYYGDSDRFPELWRSMRQRHAAIDAGEQDYELMHQAHADAFDPDEGRLDRGHTMYGRRPVYRAEDMEED